MMDIRPIDENFAVAAQLNPEDIAEIAAQGYKTLICNRPDDEQDGQPEYASIAAAAEQAGLKTYFIPVSGGMITQQHVDEMIAALNEAPAPFLAYCRSGTRCLNLYGIVRQQTQG
jgi:uncharacterized protein (TIGR01244 family)